MTEGRKYLLFITALHVLFFVLAVVHGGIRLPDSEDYIAQAQNIREQGSFYAASFEQPVKIDYYSKRPPLYALFIIAITTLIPSLYGVLAVQNLLGILNAWLVFVLLSKYFRVRRAGLWAGILWVVFPNQLLYANMVMSETLLQTFLLGAFYCFVRYWQAPQLKWSVINNVLLALALLTKPVMLYFWIINAVAFIIVGIRHRQYIAALPVLLLPLVAALWSQKNYRDTGYRHYSSITHVNLKDYNTKYFLFDKYGSEYGDSVIAVIDRKVAVLPDYKSKCLYIRDTCATILLSDVPAYAKFHAKGMVNFMADPGRYDYISFFAIPQTDALGLLHYVSKGNMQELKQFISTQPLWLIVLLVMEMLANGLVLLLCIVFVCARSMPLWPKLYLLGMTGYIWFLTGPIGSARFKVPIYPLMVMAAVIAIHWLYARKKGAKNNVLPG